MPIQQDSTTRVRCAARWYVSRRCVRPGSAQQPRPRRHDGCGKGRPRGWSAPLTDDTSDDIVSWVDGQVVTDWPAEIAKRDAPSTAT